MQGARKYAAALVAALTVLLAAASGAGAAKPKLLLKDYGTPISAGAEIGEQLTVTRNGETCHGQTEGTLKSNGMVKDLATAYEFGTECLGLESSEYAMSQELNGEQTSTVTLTSSGQWQVSLKPKLLITLPGPCTYEWTKLKLTFTPGGRAETGSENDKGKLRKAGSSPTCAKQEAVAFQDELWAKGGTGLPIETELVS